MWQLRKRIAMTNVSCVSDSGSSPSRSLCLSPATGWRASVASPRCPYAFSAAPICHRVRTWRGCADRGVERGTTGGGGLITDTPRQNRPGDGGVKAQNQRVSHLKGTQPNRPPRLHYHSRKCVRGFFEENALTNEQSN